jgi:hypothetical protein
MNYCPEKAIEVAYSWAIPVWIFSVYLIGKFFGLLELKNFWMWHPLSIPVYILLFQMSYIVFWRLTGIKIVNSFFRNTSLTSIFRRYHAPGITVDDLIDSQ